MVLLPVLSVTRRSRCETRLRGRRLQEIRAEWFRLHPLCAECERAGRKARLAVELDHIVALENGGPDFDVDGGTNRQGLCKPCHAAKTAIDLGHRPARRIGADGFPVEG